MSFNAARLLKDWLHTQPSWPPNTWLYGADLNVYVRHGRHVVDQQDNRVHDCLDIANIEVREKRSGVFKIFLSEAENLNPWPIMYLENVEYDWLERFYEKSGYTRILNPYGGFPSFYKKNPKWGGAEDSAPPVTDH